MSEFVQANVERFSGFAACYDEARPQPPAVVMDILTRMAGVDPPSLVVDLGSGTGHSTRLWAGRAREVVGVEPTAEMRAEAQKATSSASGEQGIRYVDGDSARTGLPEGSVDIVTAVQSFHWMEPSATLAEIARILRAGGVFAAVDCDWPPLVHWELDAAFSALMANVDALQKQVGVYDEVRRWPKAQHLARMRESGRFRHVRETLVQKVESGDAGRFVGLALSMGGLRSLLKRGLAEEEIGLDRLRLAATRILGGATAPWFFSYRVRLGVK